MTAGARHATDKAFAQPQPGHVDGFGLQPLGRAKFQRVDIAEQIDRTDLGSHRIGDVMGDLVQPVLTATGRRQCVTQPPEQLP